MLVSISLLRRLFCLTKISAVFLGKTASSRLELRETGAVCRLRCCWCFRAQPRFEQTAAVVVRRIPKHNNTPESSSSLIPPQ